MSGGVSTVYSTIVSRGGVREAGCAEPSRGPPAPCPAARAPGEAARPTGVRQARSTGRPPPSHHLHRKPSPAPLRHGMPQRRRPDAGVVLVHGVERRVHACLERASSLSGVAAWVVTPPPAYRGGCPWQAGAPARRPHSRHIPGTDRTYLLCCSLRHRSGARAAARRRHAGGAAPVGRSRSVRFRCRAGRGSRSGRVPVSGRGAGPR